MFFSHSLYHDAASIGWKPSCPRQTVFALDSHFLLIVKWTICSVDLMFQCCMKAALTQQSCCYVYCANMALLFLVSVFLVGTSCIGTCGRSIVTDEYLCVKGSKGTIFAMGDAATVEQPKALDTAKVLPCPALPCPDLPCPALPCPALAYPVLACSSLPPSTARSLALPCPFLPCLACPFAPVPPVPTLPLSYPVLVLPGPIHIIPLCLAFALACHSYPVFGNRPYCNLSALPQLVLLVLCRFAAMYNCCLLHSIIVLNFSCTKLPHHAAPRCVHKKQSQIISLSCPVPARSPPQPTIPSSGPLPSL